MVEGWLKGSDREATGNAKRREGRTESHGAERTGRVRHQIALAARQRCARRVRRPAPSQKARKAITATPRGGKNLGQPHFFLAIAEKYTIRQIKNFPG
jgi:hypothetical protein